MTALSDIPCVILAGGGSRRFGSPKGLADFNGAPLISRIVEIISRQSSAPIAINANETGHFQALALPILSDDADKAGIGPLAGISAAMRWGQKLKASTVATLAVDTPFIPSDFLARLERAGAPAVASSEGRIHAVCGLWQPQQLETLEDGIANGVRAAREWVNLCGARVCEFERSGGHDPFFNVNTPDDLKRALHILRS